MKRLCKNCDYWERNTHNPINGECRRHSPIVTAASCGIGENPEYSNYWPSIHDNDWCGEFKQSIKATDDRERERKK